MYFAKDMTAQVAQVRKWLKQDGVFFVGYQEGDVVPRTEDVHTTLLARAVQACGMRYEAEDLTMQTYALLKKKRMAALAHQQAFEQESNRAWFDLLMAQTEYAECTQEAFRQKMARYLYVIRQ